jgi:uncharacterized protein
MSYEKLNADRLLSNPPDGLRPFAERRPRRTGGHRQSCLPAWAPLLCLTLLLCSCSSPSPHTAQAADPQMASQRLAHPQQLPLSAQVTIGNQTIALEVAKTPEQQEIGLMNRTALPDNQGMLFVFEPARPVGFWMKNTLIPLDIVFLHEGVVQMIAPAAPCQADPCPTYQPTGLIDQVIELRQGRAQELGLKVADRLTVQFR